MAAYAAIHTPCSAPVVMLRYAIFASDARVIDMMLMMLRVAAPRVIISMPLIGYAAEFLARYFLRHGCRYDAAAITFRRPWLFSLLCHVIILIRHYYLLRHLFGAALPLDSLADASSFFSIRYDGALISPDTFDYAAAFVCFK